jgi:hypothetical protein
MKILQISTSDKSGGAAIAVFRLHSTMLLSGIDSRYLVIEKTINDRVDIVSVSKYSHRIGKIINVILERIATKNMHGVRGLFSSFKYGINISKRQEIIGADVIYLHCINSFVI